MDNAAERFETAAQASYTSEMADVCRAAEMLDGAEDYDTARDAVDEMMSSPLDVSSVRCVQVLLGTGGPARGYHIFIDEDSEPTSGYFWYQDWFQPKRVFWLNSEQLSQVVQAYNLYLGE